MTDLLHDDKPAKTVDEAVARLNTRHEMLMRMDYPNHRIPTKRQLRLEIRREMGLVGFDPITILLIASLILQIVNAAIDLWERLRGVETALHFANRESRES